MGHLPPAGLWALSLLAPFGIWVAKWPHQDLWIHVSGFCFGWGREGVEEWEEPPEPKATGSPHRVCHSPA